MATVEVAAPVGLIASEEEQVNALEEALKVTEIEPTTEKVFEEETPCSPAENILATEETVDELSSTPGEDSAEKLTVASPASEPETESAQSESKEEAAQVPKAADPAKEVSVAEAPVESTAAEEKVEESSAKEEAAVEVADEKTASVEESTVVVEEPKPPEAAPAEDEKKTEE